MGERYIGTIKDRNENWKDCIKLQGRTLRKFGNTHPDASPYDSDKSPAAEH